MKPLPLAGPAPQPLSTPERAHYEFSSFVPCCLTVLEVSPVDMIDIAARTGYSHVGLRLEPATPEEYHFPLVNDPALRRQTLKRLHDTGIKVLDIEILRLKPQTCVSDFDKILSVGAEFGATELLVAGNDPDEQRMTDNFAQLCDLSRPYGIYPHLEFMPWTDARTCSRRCGWLSRRVASMAAYWSMPSISTALAQALKT